MSEAHLDLFQPETPPTLAFQAISEALFGGDVALDLYRFVEPENTHDFFLTLIKIYNLHLGPLSPLDGEARYASHPAVASLKWTLENRWLSDLGRLQVPDTPTDPLELLASLMSRPLPEPYQNVKNSGSDLLILNAYHNAVNESFSHLGQLSAVKSLPALRAFGLENIVDEVPELGYAAYPHELLALEAFAGLLATNHWLLPEALGALATHALLTPPRWNALKDAWVDADNLSRLRSRSDFDALDPTLVLDVVSGALTTHPQWASRTMTGMHWYLYLDEALSARLSRNL